MNFKNKKVVIIHSGSNEDEANFDTLQQAKEIANILKKSSIPFAVGNIKDEGLIQKIINYDKNKIIIFNLVETLKYSDAKIYQFTTFLDFLNLCYTGATSHFLLLTQNKITTKKILKTSKINTPKWIEEDKITDKKLSKKYIVKSAIEHCSLGIDDNSIADVNLAQITKEKKQKYGGVWFAEEYIEGREFNISVMKIEGKLKILPLAEMIFYEDPSKSSRIVDYQAKWDGSLNYRSFDSNVSTKLANNIRKTILKLVQIFNINSYARIDLRVNKNEKVFVIDINANPCLSFDAGFMAACKKFGLTPKNVIINILKNASDNESGN